MGDDREALPDGGTQRRRFLVGVGVGATALAVPLAGCGNQAAPVVAWAGGGRIERAFADPLLELGRLLKEAAEIEHDLMVQYLYAAFSVKPAFAAIVGTGAPGADTLLGVAVQEMQHLRAVNQLLVEIGFAPALTRHDFPAETDLYPFPFELEPLTARSLAKYAYCEAPPSALVASTGADMRFVALLEKELGPAMRPNHVGTLYDAIIGLVRELAAEPETPMKRADYWVDSLTAIKDEGEDDHYRFFRGLLLGEHPALRGRPKIWSGEPGDDGFPSAKLPVNPTAYTGHPGFIADAQAARLAWLGNLFYWISLGVLDLSYRGVLPNGPGVAQSIMAGPLLGIARHLAGMGQGMPFDPLSMGYAPGIDARHNLRILTRLVGEAQSCGDRFGSDVSAIIDRRFLTDLGQKIERWHVNDG